MQCTATDEVEHNIKMVPILNPKKIIMATCVAPDQAVQPWLASSLGCR